jgi:phage terminase small subunit
MTSKAEAKAAKEMLFIDTYLANGCIGAKAYVHAGYKAKNANVAAVMANRLLRNPKIAGLIKSRTRERLEMAQLTANESMASLARDVKFNPRQLLRAIGVPAEIIDQLDDDTLKALRGFKMNPVEIGKGRQKRIAYRVEVKFPEKTAAREQAMKHFGLYERDNKQKPFYTPPKLVIVGVPGRK